MLISCDNDPDFEPLSTTKQAYTGNQLRVDGFYYWPYDNRYYDGYFFYRDGTILSTGGGSDSLEEEENYIKDRFINDNDYKKDRAWWGQFFIDGNNIKFERWYIGGTILSVYFREGTILNDTTFHITESYKLVDGQKTEYKTLDETYHFKAFSPKPDSTNVFVK